MKIILISYLRLEKTTEEGWGKTSQAEKGKIYSYQAINYNNTIYKTKFFFQC